MSNLVPHSYAEFDSSHYLTLADIVFTKRTMKVQMKWSKTMQTKDKSHTIILPKYFHPLCARCQLSNQQYRGTTLVERTLFLIHTSNDFKMVSESRLKKVLEKFFAAWVPPIFYISHIQVVGRHVCV